MTKSPDPAPEKSQKTNPPPQPRLVIPPDLKAVYSNLVRIAHTPSELVYDFSRLLPGDQEASVLARVMMSPLSAKLFHRALSENLAKYESVYGEIAIPHMQTLADYLFRPPQAPDSPPEK
ncbi:MAG: DUF3467 domain-containing protein [Anaerolineae bacterium]|nr:DUF3467 domain-containing protein [Anaerolineae bacterium]